jgi:hypothetical protein
MSNVNGVGAERVCFLRLLAALVLPGGRVGILKLPRERP